MAPNVTLRLQKVSDAKRFFEILDNPNFEFFHMCPKDVEGEKEFLIDNARKMKNNIEYNYSILYDNELVGACGIKINQHRNYIGEIGYFLDEAFWGKGIVTRAVQLLEKIGFKELGLSRIEILMNPKNIGSEKVAIKCGYKKEGTKSKAIKDNGILQDAHLYAKVF